MKCLIVLWLVGCACAISSAATAQIAYVDQSRGVSSFYSGQPGHPLCNQSFSAPDFNAFNQTVSCPGLGTAIFATQNSTLGQAVIDCQIAVRAPNSVSSASSNLLVHFNLTQEMHYTLVGEVASPKSLSEVRLTGPGGEMHHPSGTMTFSNCGTLPAGSFELYANSFQSQGSVEIPTNTIVATLRITRAGDVNADNSVNIDDLVGVITAWGTCTNPQNCPEDMNCDGAINIDDLVAIITNWG